MSFKRLRTKPNFYLFTTIVDFTAWNNILHMWRAVGKIATLYQPFQEKWRYHIFVTSDYHGSKSKQNHDSSISQGLSYIYKLLIIAALIFGKF